VADKIYNNRWYRVTVRDVITRLADHYGQTETITEAIVPGEKARMYRDHHKCDRIEEHQGPVYRVRWYRYGDTTFPETYCVASRDEAEKLRAEMEEDRERYLAGLEWEIASYMRSAERSDISRHGAELYLRVARKCKDELERARVADWKFTVERVDDTGAARRDKAVKEGFT